MKRIISLCILYIILTSCANKEHEKETIQQTDTSQVKRDTTEVKSKSVFIKIVNDSLVHKPIIKGILFCNYSKDTIYLLVSGSSSPPAFHYSEINYSIGAGYWYLGIPEYSSLDRDVMKIIPLENRFLKFTIGIRKIDKTMIDSIDEISYRYYKNRISDTTEVRCKDAFAFKVNKYYQYKSKREGW